MDGSENHSSVDNSQSYRRTSSCRSIPKSKPRTCSSPEWPRKSWRYPPTNGTTQHGPPSIFHFLWPIQLMACRRTNTIICSFQMLPIWDPTINSRLGSAQRLRLRAKKKSPTESINLYRTSVRLVKRIDLTSCRCKSLARVRINRRRYSVSAEQAKGQNGCRSPKHLRKNVGR